MFYNYVVNEDVGPS